MEEGIEDEHRYLRLLDLRERQGVLEVDARFTGFLSSSWSCSSTVARCA